jgi:hypothetical protein
VSDEPLYCPLCGSEDYECRHTADEIDAGPCEFCEICGAHERDHAHDCSDVGGIEARA